MFIKRIDFVQTDFESTSGIVKSVVDSELTVDYGTKKYRPVSLKFKNYSGETVNFLPLTSDESEAFFDDQTISDLIPVVNNAEEILNSLSGEITQVFVKGNSGASYTSGAICILVQE